MRYLSIISRAGIEPATWGVPPIIRSTHFNYTFLSIEQLHIHTSNYNPPLYQLSYLECGIYYITYSYIAESHDAENTIRVVYIHHGRRRFSRQMNGLYAHCKSAWRSRGRQVRSCFAQFARMAPAWRVKDFHRRI